MKYIPQTTLTPSDNLHVANMRNLSHCGPKNSKVSRRQMRRTRISGPGKRVPATSVVDTDKSSGIL